MQELQGANFKMIWAEQEEHWMMPELTTLVSVQGLYDILFQYLLSEEKERLLTLFIKKVEYYLENRRTGLGNGPFSVPARELEFLEEGVEELRYLQWFSIPVYRVRLLTGDDRIPEETDWEQIEPVLKNTLVFNRAQEGDYCHLYVYPASLV